MRIQSNNTNAIDCSQSLHQPTGRAATIERAQDELRELGSPYADLASSGSEDGATRAALAHFQEGHGLQVTGELNSSTVERIHTAIGQVRAERAAVEEQSPAGFGQGIPPNMGANALQARLLAAAEAPTTSGVQVPTTRVSHSPLSPNDLERIEEACNFVHGEQGANVLSDALEQVGLSPRRQRYGLRRLLTDLGTPNLFFSAKRLRQSGSTERFSQNLNAALSDTFDDGSLVMSLLQREGGWARGVGGGSSSETDHYQSFDDGGMDELWRIRNAVDSDGARYFPQTMIDGWSRDEFFNGETGEISIAALIPTHQEGGYLAAMTGYLHWARDAKVLEPMAEVLGEDTVRSMWDNADVAVQRTWTAFAFARPGRARRAALEVANNPELELSDLLLEGDFRDRMNSDGAVSRSMHAAAEALAIDGMRTP